MGISWFFDGSTKKRHDFQLQELHVQWKLVSVIW